ncbi:MAG: HlyD family type I secretion periplasmic adaptor subunit, partial [Desulfobacteraceae bacterium]|nr:HlyD family type I secretion periplasmic adaptor subunit [Desulfobacteraceae bacterium]
MQIIKRIKITITDLFSKIKFWIVQLFIKIHKKIALLLTRFKLWTIGIYGKTPEWIEQIRQQRIKIWYQISNSTIGNNLKKYLKQQEFENEYQEALSFQPDVVAVEEKTLPKAFRLTLYILFACILFCLTWSVFSSIDKIIIGQGNLITCDRSMVVQPLETSVIRSIEVKVGDIVKKDQILARLDPTISEATTEQIKSKLDFINALIKRLEAETKWSSKIIADYNEVIVPAEKPSRYFSDNTAKVNNNSLLKLQKRILEQRENLFSSKVDSFLFDINFLNKNTNASIKRQAQIKKQIKVAGEIESMYYKMYKAKQGSRLTYLKAYENKEKIDSALTDEQEYEDQLSEKIKKAQSDRLVFVNTWNSEIVERLFTAHQEKNVLTQSLIKASRYNELVQLKAGREAIVKEVADYSVGSVIKSAETFFTLIPLDSDLEAEVKIPAKDIAHIKVGSSVRIKLDAFPFQKHGTIKGKVRVISPDAYFSQQMDLKTKGNNPFIYYKALIEFTNTNLQNVRQDFKLIPGMTVRGE